jgi:hypothetical protein
MCPPTWASAPQGCVAYGRSPRRIDPLVDPGIDVMHARGVRAHDDMGDFADEECVVAGSIASRTRHSSAPRDCASAGHRPSPPLPSAAPPQRTCPRCGPRPAAIADHLVPSRGARNSPNEDPSSAGGRRPARAVDGDSEHMRWNDRTMCESTGQMLSTPWCRSRPGPPAAAPYRRRGLKVDSCRPRRIRSTFLAPRCSAHISSRNMRSTVSDFSLSFQ